MAERSKQTRDCLLLTTDREFSPSGLSLTIAALIVNMICASARAQEDAPCPQIKAACVQAGFKAGSGKEGFGLWIDCINPVMRGVPQRAKAAKPLPQIDAQLIAACKSKNPDFGQRKRAPSPSPSLSPSPSSAGNERLGETVTNCGGPDMRDVL